MTHQGRHIALFLRSLIGHGGGGAERSMVNLAAALSARGHRVDLVLARGEGPYLAEVPDSVRCIDLKVKGSSAVLQSIALHPRLLRGLAPVWFGLKGHWSLGAVPKLARYL